MANNITMTMDSLKEEAVRVYSGMIAVLPQFPRSEKILDVSDMAPKFNGCYATNNSTVCFVSDNEVFVTPYTYLIIHALDLAGFDEESFYVPFSNGDYPKFEQIKWNSLREKASRLRKEKFIEDCVSYCDEHGIGTINDETLQNCFEMPATGVKVKHFHFENCYYPILNNDCIEGRTIECLGHFCTNNGRVVFVYRNGKTYVAKGYKILHELYTAGYTELGLFVPFSNGEQIQDPVLNARWESIEK